MMRRSERGDTIIEVMFAMTIIGVVLGAAYSVASKNLQVSQLAKERTQATELAVGQLDQLKSLEDLAGNDIIMSGDPFCLDIQSAEYVIEVDSDAGAACTVSELFERSIVRTTDGIYVVKVEWIPPGGSEANKSVVEFNYKDYDLSLAGDPAIITSVDSYSPDGTGAVLSMSIVNTAGIVESGIVYGTINPPTLENGTKAVMVGNKTTITGLSPGLTYYAWAYTINSEGVKTYGITKTIGDFSESQNRPIVVTDSAIATSQSTATVAGRVTDDKGATDLERGIAYGTIAAPTITNGKIVDTSGTGAGTFSLNITGLTPNTTYYIRAYAKPLIGGSTTYGEALSFKTASAPGELGAPKTFNGHLYMLSLAPANWTEAKRVAGLSGGHLVTITSAAENTFVSQLAAGTRIWIGLNDSEKEGKWKWVTGESKTYENWAPSEPNDWLNGSPGEDGAVINWTGTNSDWNDWIATELAYYVIEYETTVQVGGGGNESQ